jgi:superfamily II DNA or RNA helicase
MSLNLRDYQEKTLSALRDGFKAGHKAQILYLPTGGGKCLGLNTPVLMANGKVKMVQDVIVGDQLLGPDGGIRNVLSLAVGREMLYRITPVKGDSYVVNASHILSLRKTNGHSTDIVNLNVEAFMASDKSQMLKGWRSVPIADKNNNLSFNINAYSVHDISIESIGEGYYYGFEIDGGKLFLLGDFTVTHNTECAIALLDAVKKKGNRSAMILDRIILCDQTSQRLTKYGIDHGVLQSGHWRYRPHEKIQVCSAQTLERRNEFPGLQIMIIDEAHVFRDALKKFIEANPDILVIGLTATPFTKGLGKTFTNVVSTITTKELVDQKVLVPLRVYLAKEIDMTGAKKVAGEWSQEEATTRGIKITGDIVAEWIKKTHEIFGEPRKTIVFCSGVAHGADLAEKFAEQGYNFMPLSYKDSDEFKRDAVEDFKRPDTKIHGLIATDILTRGFDVPDVMIGVSARPFTKSLSSHVQQMGRVMRGHDEKSFAVWLCHSGNFLRFREDWDDLFENGVSELDDGKEKTKPEPTEKEKKQSKCPKCGALWLGGDVCSMCGFVRERTNAVSAVPGTMEELTGSASREKKQEWWSQIQWYVQTQGWSPGRGAHLYKDKFGIWPKGLSDTAASPGAEINAFILKKKREYIKSIRRGR